jgi:hypothetical protein
VSERTQEVTDLLVEYTDALYAGEPVPEALEPDLADEVRPLLETVELLHGVLREAPVPAELAQRLEGRLAAEWKAMQKKPVHIPQVLRQAFEQLISRALSDEGFRTQLIEDPERAALRMGLTLTPYELAALKTLDQNQLASLIEELDERVSKTGIGTVDLSSLMGLSD